MPFNEHGERRRQSDDFDAPEVHRAIVEMVTVVRTLKGGELANGSELVASVTKSVTATLIGIAMGRGDIGGLQGVEPGAPLDRPVMDFFPE